MTRTEDEIYRIMNVDEHATIEDIKKQYRVLAMVHHPDRNGGDENKFKELQEAYEILLDPEKKKALRKVPKKTPSENTVESIFRSMYAFHAKQERVTVSINADEVMYGCYRTLRVAKERDCEECDRTGVANHKKNVIQCRECYGKGTNLMFPEMKCFSCGGQGIFVLNHTKCSVCQGKRVVETHDQHVVYIPPGTQPSDVLHPSDSLVVIVRHELERDDIRFDGNHVELFVDITPKELLLGFSKRVQMAHIMYEVRSKHSFDIQRIIKLQNKGVNEKGDLTIRFRLRPSSSEEQAFLIKLRKAIHKIGLCESISSEDPGEDTVLLDVQDDQQDE